MKNVRFTKKFKCFMIVVVIYIALSSFSNNTNHNADVCKFLDSIEYSNTIIEEEPRAESESLNRICTLSYVDCN